MAVPFVSLQMPSSPGNRKFQTNVMKAYRKQRHYNFRHCQPCHITRVIHAHAVILAVCLLMLPMLELATEHVHLTTTCRMNPINRVPPSRSHTPLVLPSLNNVLPAMVLQNIKCLSYISSVRHVSLSPALTAPTSLGRRVVGMVVLLLLLMSGDIETNPGPVGECVF